MREIDLIIDENESQVVEWKESWQDKYLEWICGYANAQGGTLYIGIDDNGNVLGLEEKIVKKLLEDIPNKITAAFGMTCDVNLRTKDKKKYIQIEVKKSKLPLNLHGRYYYRTGSVKKEITGFELTEFIIKSTGTSYDEMTSDIPREKLTFESLRKRYLKATRLSLAIVITNPGGMFDGSEVQLLDIRHVPSKLRNPILADVFGRMRLMERRGSGFKKILDAYESEERYKEELKPVFYTDGYNFFLTLWNLNYAYDKAQNKAQNKAQKNQMTDREYILLLLKENPSLTQVELSEMMDKSRRTVQMLMKELLDEGVIERIGSKKKGSWLVK